MDFPYGRTGTPIVLVMAGLSAGLLLLLPRPAHALTCGKVIWAVRHLSHAELEAAAAALSIAERAKAYKCVRDASDKGLRIDVKATSGRSGT